MDKHIVSKYEGVFGVIWQKVAYVLYKEFTVGLKGRNQGSPTYSSYSWGSKQGP